jgi:hypothetical protein
MKLWDGRNFFLVEMNDSTDVSEVGLGSKWAPCDVPIEREAERSIELSGLQILYEIGAQQSPSLKILGRQVERLLWILIR